MKNNLLAFFLLLSITASAQSLEFSSGIYLNNFYDFKNEDGFYTSSYTPNVGYDLNIGVDDIYLNTVRFRFTLGLNMYSGGVQAIKRGGQNRSYSIDGQMQKTVLRLGFYPINLGNKKRLNINIGPQFSMLIHKKVEGTYDEWYVAINEYNNPYVVESSGNLTERFDSYNAKFYGGINARIAYDIPLSKNFYLIPQYSLYIGLTNEFTEFPNTTKSLHNMLGIGIKRKL